MKKTLPVRQLITTVPTVLAQEFPLKEQGMSQIESIRFWKIYRKLLEKGGESCLIETKTTNTLVSASVELQNECSTLALEAEFHCWRNFKKPSE